MKDIRFQCSKARMAVLASTQFATLSGLLSGAPAKQGG